MVRGQRHKKYREEELHPPEPYGNCQSRESRDIDRKKGRAGNDLSVESSRWSEPRSLSRNHDNGDSELAILIMGVTGSGKSTFISRLTSDVVQIGHSLDSCTSEVQGYSIDHGHGQQVCLVDTPGFDDSQVSDVDLLKKIASSLDIMHERDDMRFGGLIYMQRITDPRVSGSSLKSLRIFERLCGEENFRHVTLVTTMWNLLSSSSIGEDREKDLCGTEQFFGKMIAGGATIMRDYGQYSGARDIIGRVAQQKNDIIMALHSEMSKPGTALSDTSVGRYLRDAMEAVRERCEIEKKELEEALAKALKDQDDDWISEIEDQQRDCAAKLKGSDIDERNLSVTKEELRKLGDDLSARKLQEISARRHETEIQTAEVYQMKAKLSQQEQELRNLRNEGVRENELLQHLVAEMQHMQDRIDINMAQQNAKKRELQFDEIAARWWGKCQRSLVGWEYANLLPRLHESAKVKAREKLKKETRSRGRASSPKDTSVARTIQDDISPEAPMSSGQFYNTVTVQPSYQFTVPQRAMTHPTKLTSYEIKTGLLGPPRRVASPDGLMNVVRRPPT